jgi:hypothetical protein
MLLFMRSMPQPQLQLFMLALKPVARYRLRKVLPVAQAFN